MTPARPTADEKEIDAMNQSGRAHSNILMSLLLPENISCEQKIIDIGRQWIFIAICSAKILALHIRRLALRHFAFEGMLAA
jgi:hypothetical protein